MLDKKTQRPSTLSFYMCFVRHVYCEQLHTLTLITFNSLACECSALPFLLPFDTDFSTLIFFMLVQHTLSPNHQCNLYCKL